MKIDIQLEKLFEMIIDKIYGQAQTTSTVVKWLKKQYGLETSRSYEVIREAKKWFGEYMKAYDETTLDDVLNILKNNIEEAKKTKNLKEVRESLKEISKLKGFYAPEKIEHTHNIEQPLFGPKKDNE
jgi:hypothetical protein